MLRAAEFTSNHLYPTSDGRPMAETDYHRKLMNILIQILDQRYAADPDTYVSGNLLIFYRPNYKRRHVSPDCFVVFGVPKKDRLNYLTWEEGKGPDVVIELTSKTTKREDVVTKHALYRDTLKVKEYFLFDPFEDYLDPSMQGFRLRAGQYQPIRMKDGRLPSQQLGLHLERSGHSLRLWDPTIGTWLPTPDETIEAERERADHLAAEVERLRKLLANQKNGHTSNGAT
jgi:Uma2 family endonuclease